MGNYCECSREEEIGQEKISFRLIIDDGSSIDNFTNEIEAESTIGDLKRRVASKCGVSEEFHHLVKLHFEGQVLREEMVISHCPQLLPHVAIHVKQIERAKIRANCKAAAKMNVHRAAKKSDVSTLKFIAEFAPERINEPDENGCPPLYWASTNEQVDDIKILLEAKASVNQVTPIGASPLYIAAFNNREEAVRVLLEAGANVNQGLHGSMTLSEGEEYGQTPLCASSSEQVKELLRKAGGHDNTVKRGEIAPG